MGYPPVHVPMLLDLVMVYPSYRMVWIHGRQWGPQRAGYRIRGISSMHSRFGFVASGYLDSRVSVSDLGRNYEALDSIEDDEKDCCTKSSMLDDGDEDHCSYDGGFFRCEQHRSNCSVDEELGLPTAVLSSYSGRRADERPVVWRGRKVRNDSINKDEPARVGLGHRSFCRILNLSSYLTFIHSVSHLKTWTSDFLFHRRF